MREYDKLRLRTLRKMRLPIGRKEKDYIGTAEPKKFIEYIPEDQYPLKFLDYLLKQNKNSDIIPSNKSS